MNKDPLVLLPGMMCDARLFFPQIEAFSAQRTVCTHPLNSHSTVAGLAAQVLNNSPPRFALAGLSMGGIVAMEVYRQAPDRISHLALLDTSPLPETPERASAREPQLAAVADGKLRQVMRDEMKPNYLFEAPNCTEILDLCMDMADTQGADVFISQSRALQTRPDQSDTLRKISVPTLILCGEHDALCPVERHQLMHELITGSNFNVIKNAGHLPTLEQPQATNAVLQEWLST